MITNEIVCAYCGDGFNNDELLEQHYADLHAERIKRAKELDNAKVHKRRNKASY